MSGRRLLPMRRPEAHTHFEIPPPDDPNHDELRDWAEWADWFSLWPMDERGKRVVPLRYTTPDGRMLGWWLQKQRLARKKGLLRKQAFFLSRTPIPPPAFLTPPILPIYTIPFFRSTWTS